MPMTRDDVLDKVRDVLAEALGADEDEITPEASLTADLGAESIDFLDIVFRLEKTFSAPGAPFKISAGELFPENLMENPAWVQSGKVTDEGMKMLQQRMPHVDFSSFDRDVSKLPALITVSSIASFVQRKLAAG